MAETSSFNRSFLFEYLKQRIGGTRSVDLPVSAYGKLPIYKDFLRHGLARTESQALKKWLDRGISKHWSNHGACRQHEIAPHSLFLSFPATGRHILGYLWGSHDHGALRRFPFILFVPLPASKARAPVALLDALGQLARQAAVLRRKLARLSTVDDFYPLIRTTTIKLTLHPNKMIREQLASEREPTVGNLGESLFGEDSERLWPELLARLRRPADKRQTFAARLPSSSTVTAEKLAAIWCLLLAHLRKNPRAPLQLLYAAEEPAGISILHRELQREDIFLLHPEKEISSHSATEDLRWRMPADPKVETLTTRQLAQPLCSLMEKNFG